MSSGSHSAASSGVARSAGTAANVMVIGQPCPASACELMYMAARATCAPGRSLVHARQRHQLVPRRVELDLVDAVAVAVEGLQLGRVLVGQAAPLLDLRAAP